MRLKLTMISLFVTVSVTACYMPITGRVIDAETSQPIEGAVVLVEWTKTHGFGEYWTESYKVVETMSDKNGDVKLDGCYSPFVNKPDVTVYKKGYVAWSSRWIFPDRRNRTDYKWGDDIFKLQCFKEVYSHDAHTDFIRSSINSSMTLESKKTIYNAFRWEDRLAFEEREKLRK